MNVLEEADELTRGARADTYGAADRNAQAWAQIFGAVTGLDIQPKHLPIAMIALKLARLSGAGFYDRDSIVDIAGYARVAEMIEERR